jgi:formate hydrogenlyase transcriptional activator
MGISDLIGASSRFRALISNIELVAPTDSAVLLQGETGTGKEVVARAIYESGPRRRNRFVALNCAAIPSTLLESELFGYEKGAFTGAVNQTVGRFQAADRGTLFLDEIGDLPLELQPKLLRALQEKQFERLGGHQTHHVDVRVIAATNQDLGQMVRDRKFRADLFYRLNVFPMTLPPLRERPEDIALLAEHFVEEFARRQGKVIETIPDDVMDLLELYNWPGNIRELQNVIERGVIMTTGPVLSRQTIEHLAASVRVSAAGERGGIERIADVERGVITAALRATNWVVGGPKGAAAQLGLPRTTLLSRMQRLGIPSGVVQRRRRSIGKFAQVTGEMSSHLRDGLSDRLQVMEAVAV